MPNSRRLTRREWHRLLILAVVVAAFAALADGAGEQDRIAHFDAAATQWFQHHRTATLENFFLVLSYVGFPGIMIMDVIVGAVLAVRRQWRSFALWTIAVGGASLVALAIKLIVHRPRPPFAADFINAPTQSFPSGHAVSAMAGLSMLVYMMYHRGDRAAQWGLQIGAGLLIVAIGFSRIYLGVHYPSDVLAGFLVGGAWVLACEAVDTYLRRGRERDEEERSALGA